MSDHPNLRMGDKGPWVTLLQQELIIHGFDCGVADGDFGPKTRQAVVAFQSSRGLPPTASSGR